MSELPTGDVAGELNRPAWSLEPPAAEAESRSAESVEPELAALEQELAALLAKQSQHSVNREAKAGSETASEEINRKIDELRRDVLAQRQQAIGAKRETHLPADTINEKVRLTVEQNNAVLESITRKADALFRTVSPYLPHAKVTLEAGKEEVRPASVTELRHWIQTPALRAYLTDQARLTYPNEPQRILSEVVEDQLSSIHTLVSLQEARDVLLGERNVPADQLSDDQKINRAFRKFSLQELIDSRVVREYTLTRLAEVNEALSFVTEHKLLGRITPLTNEKAELERELLKQIHESPEAYYDYWAHELLDAQRAFAESGTMYETPFVQAKIGKIMSLLEDGSPVFIHGETGTGKTELAKHIARSRFGKEALIIPGRRDTELSEVTEIQDIRLAEAQLPEAQRAEIHARVRAATESSEFNARTADLAQITGQTIEEARAAEIAKLEAGYVEYFRRPVELKGRLQPFYQAAREGRMVIIDEMNAIPHHTLIALNDLLTHRALDQATYDRYTRGELSIDQISSAHKVQPIYGQEPFVIAPGFSIVATGNWKPEDGKNYVGRQQLDAAFMRRFGIVHYDYLPNELGELEGAGMDSDEERRRKGNSELFRMLVARLLQNDLSIELPENGFDQLESLARVARIIQDGFSGRTLPSVFQPKTLTGSGGQLEITDVLRENVLDLGKLTQLVLTPWQREGYSKPLEAYLFDRYILRSSARPQEFVYLYKLFQLHGFFDPEQGWPSLVDLRVGAQPASTPQGTPAEQAQLQRDRIQDVLTFGAKLEGKIYAGKSENEPMAVAPMKRFELQTVIDRVMGQPASRNRYPDLERAVAPEAPVEPQIEIMDTAELEWRNDNRTKFQEMLGLDLEEGRNRALDEIMNSVTSYDFSGFPEHTGPAIAAKVREGLALLDQNAPKAEIQAVINDINTLSVPGQK